MRHRIGVSLLIFMVITLSACQINTPEIIDADQALELLSNDSTVILLDVREYEEHIDERIEGSEILPLSVFESLVETVYPDKETTFIVYCNSGRRSDEAIQIMLALGYENLYDLGGIIDWPYETISGEIS